MCSTITGVSRATPVVLLLLLGTAVGCGGGLHPVRGKVTYDDGTPLTKGLVVFESMGGKPAVTARGDVQTDGSYQLSTNKPGDGVPAGKYRVLVSAQEYGDIDGPARPPAFDRRYMDFSTSGLEFEVKAGPNEFPIRVTRPGKARR
jgi:hypothetical protein